jgi:ATP-binding cassette subfamily C protein
MSQFTKNNNIFSIPVINEGVKETYEPFLTAVIFSFFINLLMFVSPLYMLQIYDRVVGSRSITTLIAITLLAGFLLVIYSVLESLRSRILVRAGLLFDEKIAEPVFEAIHVGNLRAPNGSHVQCLRDMDTLREFLTGSGLIAFCDFPWFPIFVLACFILHPYYGLLALFGCIVTLALTFLNEFSTKKLLNSATLANSQATQNASAIFRNTEVLQAMGMLQALKEKWSNQHEKVLSTQALASDRAGLILAFTKFFRMFLQTLILGTGAYLVIDKQISSGAIVAGSILIGRALGPIEGAVGNWKGFIAARGAYGRLLTLFSVAGPQAEKMTLPAPNGEVAVSELYVTPPGNPQNIVIKGIGFKIPPGAVVGIVGPSGAGKSSLARVLVGVWPIMRGSVRLDGNDLQHWNFAQLGRYIGYLPQDVELFSGTIAQNISRFEEGDSEEIIKAAQLAGCHELIQGLSSGYNTQIGDAGHTLSGGQRQRVALARALYGSPRLVVLDEPNASLDSEGERALLEAVIKVKSSKATSVLITHKVNILSACDLIMVMSAGGIQAYGPRDEVLQQLMAAQSGAPSPKSAALSQGAQRT